jgi:hypothetical protein
MKGIQLLGERQSQPSSLLTEAVESSLQLFSLRIPVRGIAGRPLLHLQEFGSNLALCLQETLLNVLLSHTQSVNLVQPEGYFLPEE